MSGAERSALVGGASIALALLGFGAASLTGNATLVADAFTTALALLGLAGGIGVALVLVD